MRFLIHLTKSFLLLFYFIFLLILQVNSQQYLLYIFNLPIKSNSYIIEGESIWIDEKVIQLIQNKMEIKNVKKYFDVSKKLYSLTLLCQDNKDKLVLVKNDQTKIIDVNTLRYQQQDLQNVTNNYNSLKVEDYRTLETKYFKLFYTNYQLGLILSNLLDTYYENIISFFDFRYSDLYRLNYKVPIYLAPTDEVYKKFNLVPDWSTGAFVFDFFSPTPNFVIYAHERDSFLVQRVLPHEITHLILALYWKENVMDFRTKFIQEGIAQYIEYRLLTGLEEITIHPSNKLKFQDMLYPVFNSKDDVRNFYESALSFTSFLIVQYGKYKYIQFIRKCKYSMDIIKNLNDVYQFTLFYDEKKVIDQMESGWEYFIKNSSPTPLK